MMGHAMVVGGARASAPETGILAGDLAVGSSVYLMENGVAVEYLVVNQGIPSGSSLYDASCDGTWLLRKDIIEKRAWEADNVNNLESSDIHSWLNSTMLAKYDTNIQNTIKQVKIPYRKNGGSDSTNQSGANGLSCKVFLLSGYEVGGSSSRMPVDGAILSYFSEEDSTKRIAYFDGSATHWYTRSPLTNSTYSVWLVANNGSFIGGSYCSLSQGVRPALVLPSNALFDQNTLILKGMA